MAKRAHISLKTKLAATLLQLGEVVARDGGSIAWEPFVPYEHAKQMTADQIISLYEFHHNIRHAEDGSIHFSNLEPMLRSAHRKRTAEIDVPAIAKGKRIRRKEDEHKAQRVVPLPGDGFDPNQPITWDDIEGRLEGRPWPKGRIRSRGFDTTRTKGFDGKVRKRRARHLADTESSPNQTGEG